MSAYPVTVAKRVPGSVSARPSPREFVAVLLLTAGVLSASYLVLVRPVLAHFGF